MAATCNHHYLLHHLFRKPPSQYTPVLSVFFKTTLTLIPQPQRQKNFFTPLFKLHSSTTFFCNSLSSSSSSLTLSPSSIPEPTIEDDEDTEDSEYEDEINEDEEEEIAVVKKKMNVNENVKPVAVKLPVLNIKEKKELSSYAHGLGDKLKSQLVGKSGVTASVAAAFVENLESNELLKIKIHRTCPGELDDVVKHLEEATSSVVISRIGRIVILYRPSLTKLKAEEKKMQNRKVFIRKPFSLKPTLPSREIRPEGSARPSRRGQRGSSRV